MSIKVGITERGDAGLNFTWVNKLLPANIIISKRINDDLIKILIANKNKIILHVTCTGFGASALEPNVPSKLWTKIQVDTLIEQGFPTEQIVLRIDPIIPTNRGLITAEGIMKLFEGIGIKRLRYSFIDMYSHVKYRFKDKYEFEACGEDTPHKLGCISQKDFDILKIDDKVTVLGKQRDSCLCAAGKTELLSSKKQCWHGCVYCYWKD